MSNLVKPSSEIGYDPGVASRRERYREETHREIRALALLQIEESGPDGVSLNGIAKAMGMSGPAIYRYYASRDELVTALIVDCYADLSDTLEQTAAAVRRRSPAARLQALAKAYRTWALEHPHQYMLILGHRRPVGYEEPGETVPVIHRSMLVLLDVLADLAAPEAQAEKPATALDRQLLAWSRSRDDEDSPPPHVLRLGVTAWTRIHGIVSLEIEGVFASMSLDAEALLAAEMDELVAAAATSRAS